MFGLGIPELIVICVIAFLVFGPKRLPDAGKAIGQANRGFKSSMEEKDGGRAVNKATRPGCGKDAEPEAAFCPACNRALKAKVA